ncbi:MAG: glycosyltransferase family 8 protein [Cyanobacteria bacterium RUI128]|nr:glycosyltransferase family 8 protein [Cyanobacteria bacterium RUI128]
MTQINIAFGATEEWLRYTYVTICSILANANEKDDYKFYIMCDSVDINFDPMVKCFEKIKHAEYKFIKMDNSEFEGAIHDWLGVSSSYRLKLPSIIDDDKVLYLDSDIIVLSDIAELYNHNIDDYYIAAVEDKCSHFMRERVNLKEGETFINGGVQLMNLKKFREDNLEEIIFNKLRESDFYTDQDVINDVCRSKILQLPLKFNLMPIENPGHYVNRRKEFEETLEAPVVIHYTDKPWRSEVKYGECWFFYASALSKILNSIDT